MFEKNHIYRGRITLKFAAFFCALLLFSGACADDTPNEESLLSQGGEVDDNGKPTLGGTGWSEPAGKQDSLRGRPGLATSVDRSDTAVWEVHNAWSDTDTAQAREAGIAWPRNSGLTWEEKYQAWINSFERVESEGYGETFLLTTPWGKTLPAPSLECAEVIIFLRVTFASWYQLPYFVEARDRNGQRLYFGHFGMRTARGRWQNMPNFRTLYADFTSRAQAFIDGEIDWPRDPDLAAKSIPGAFDDTQPMLPAIDGQPPHAGAYFDEIYLNKRVGYFLRLHLIYFGSINLADSANTFNLAPEAIQPGDFLLERWQRAGIGHALAVMRSRHLGHTELDGESLPQMEAELASGSMPRRQPVWNSAPASKRYFTMDETGGPGFASFGGGLKRWRQPTKIRGHWTLVVPKDARDDFINQNHTDTIAARPARFEQILTELDGEAKMNVILQVIEEKRAHLRNYPSSCAARTGREDAFKDLYEVGAELGISPEAVDRQYRRFEDYVFAELSYQASKTCCWNASTPRMYDLIIEYNLNRVEDPETRVCRDIAVFMARDDGTDGYELFRQYARSVGRADDWVAWSAGESCPQAGVASDTESAHDWAPLCDIYSDIADRL